MLRRAVYHVVRHACDEIHKYPSLQLMIITHVCAVGMDFVLECVIGLFYIRAGFQHIVNDLPRNLQICYYGNCSHTFPNLPEYRFRSTCMPHKIVLLLPAFRKSFLKVYNVLPSSSYREWNIG